MYLKWPRRVHERKLRRGSHAFAAAAVHLCHVIVYIITCWTFLFGRRRCASTKHHHSFWRPTRSAHTRTLRQFDTELCVRRPLKLLDDSECVCVCVRAGGRCACLWVCLHAAHTYTNRTWRCRRNSQLMVSKTYAAPQQQQRQRQRHQHQKPRAWAAPAEDKVYARTRRVFVLHAPLHRAICQRWRCGGGAVVGRSVYTQRASALNYVRAT